MTFEEAMNYALTLPGTERSASYGRPCVKANGSGFLFVGHEPQEPFAAYGDDHQADCSPRLFSRRHTMLAIRPCWFVTTHRMTISSVRYLAGCRLGAS